VDDQSGEICVEIMAPQQTKNGRLCTEAAVFFVGYSPKISGCTGS
jgi:hypothetical protein